MPGRSGRQGPVLQRQNLRLRDTRIHVRLHHVVRGEGLRQAVHRCERRITYIRLLDEWGLIKMRRGILLRLQLLKMMMIIGLRLDHRLLWQKHLLQFMSLLLPLL